MRASGVFFSLTKDLFNGLLARTIARSASGSKDTLHVRAGEVFERRIGAGRAVLNS